MAARVQIYVVCLLLVVMSACDRRRSPPPTATNDFASDAGIRRSAPLGLPFRDGTWLVFWGGDTATVNTHVNAPPSQRRAADLDRVDENGHVFAGDGKTNEQHFCFGSDVVAIADARVVFAVDGVPDNTPGEQSQYFISGNAVMLDLGNGVFAEYCHLKLRSVRVREGDTVKRGDVIGQCGNSGNTSQPHLHLQLQDGPRVETASAVEGVFANVKVTRAGKRQTIPAYTFLKDDRIHVVAQLE